MSTDDLDGRLDQNNSVPMLRRVYGMPGHLIRRAHQLTTAAFLECTKKHNLTPVQYAALTIVDENPGIDQQSLANMAAFDRATMGDVIQRLEQRGLLRRQNGKDRRTKSVFITPSGERVLTEMDGLVMQSQIRILAPLSDGEQIILMFLLSKLVKLNNDLSRNPFNGAQTEHTHQAMKDILRSTFTRPRRGHEDGHKSTPSPSSDKRERTSARRTRRVASPGS